MTRDRTLAAFAAMLLTVISFQQVMLLPPAIGAAALPALA